MVVVRGGCQRLGAIQARGERASTRGYLVDNDTAPVWPAGLALAVVSGIVL
jgi:hypothetical protein